MIGTLNIVTASLRIHILFVGLAFVTFTASFLVGLVFLFQRDQIKSRRPGRLMARLPSLDTMDSIHYKVLTVGFVLLSIGILSGAALLKVTQGRFFSGDSRQLASLATWGLYALFLNLRLKTAWRGRKGILLSILGFAGIVLTFLALQHH